MDKIECRPTVLICSPYRSKTIFGLSDNIGYAKRACKDSLGRGENPFAPHLFYTQFLDDDVEEERTLGIDLTTELLHMGHFTQVCVYKDKGVSSGMQGEIDLAMNLGIPVVYRQL